MFSVSALYLFIYKIKCYYFFQGAAAAKKTVKASDCAPSGSGGGLDGLPREDISAKITPALLKGLESSDWKV